MVFVAGHFGEWLQGRLGPDGPVALVTLACPVKGVRVARTGDGPLSLAGAPPVLDLSQVRRFFAELGLPTSGGYEIRPDLPPGSGAGMSTAALVGLGRVAGVTDPQRLADACLATEGASDPLMWPAPDRLLWASRRGAVLCRHDPVPACEIIGGFWGEPRRTDPADHGFPDISDLVEDWPAAGLTEMARLASLSAARCTALRGPEGDPMPDLARRLGALGHARAHTGPARALIYKPGAVPPGAEAVLRDTGLTGVLRFTTGGGL